MWEWGRNKGREKKEWRRNKMFQNEELFVLLAIVPYA